MPEGHPPATTSRADEAKSPDSKSADSGKAEAKSDISPLPPAAITHHTITVGGVPLDYTAEAGTIALPGSGGKTAANIFYVAYTREPKNTKRPITFVFNGGPGAAATYLHLGGIGPRVIEVNAKGELQGPPPALTDNPSTWLDMTDLVFVDPVGTGYSRASEAKDEDKFWGVEQDTDALDGLRAALSDQVGAHALAGLPHGRELWRLPRRLACPRAAEERRELAERHRADLAGARILAALWRGLRPAVLGARASLARRGQPRKQGRHRRAMRLASA